MTPAFLQSLGQIAATFKANKLLQHPYVVKQQGMTRLTLGEDYFQSMNMERRLWLKENCSGSVAFDQLPQGAGQEYRFESFYDAFLFKFRFGSRVFPQTEDR
ncbi:MAG: hypothetical protein ABS35_20945 [Kaistia sp. SCN 65-12]|nr:MAG: hypothetical protein ABS35_20945 [Kaistia sp. SCN 65-12]